MPYTPNPEEMDENQVAADISAFMNQACQEDAPPADEPTRIIQEAPKAAPKPKTQAKSKSQTQRRAPAKRRPKRKKDYNFFGLPQILSTGVWLAMIVFIGVTMGRFLWVCASDVLAFGREEKIVTISIMVSTVRFSRLVSMDAISAL